MGCLPLDTAVENKSLEALFQFFISQYCPLIPSIGVILIEFFSYSNSERKFLSMYILYIKKFLFVFSDHASLQTFKSFNEAGVIWISSGKEILAKRLKASACSFTP